MRDGSNKGGHRVIKVTVTQMKAKTDTCTFSPSFSGIKIFVQAKKGLIKVKPQPDGFFDYQP